MFGDDRGDNDGESSEVDGEGQGNGEHWSSEYDSEGYDVEIEYRPGRGRQFRLWSDGEDADGPESRSESEEDLVVLNPQPQTQAGSKRRPSEVDDEDGEVEDGRRVRPRVE